MSEEQVKTFLLLYSLLEPTFFDFAKGREHNIHCVPLTYTLLPAYYQNSIDYLWTRWSKYAAFNLSPLRKQGTIEFRHLYGTGDFETYKAWLTMIRKLYLYSLDFDVYSYLLRGGLCSQLHKDVFGVESPLPEEAYAISKMDVKLAFL